MNKPLKKSKKKKFSRKRQKPFKCCGNCANRDRRKIIGIVVNESCMLVENEHKAFFSNDVCKQWKLGAQQKLDL